MPNCKPGDLAIVTGRDDGLAGMIVTVLSSTFVLDAGDYYYTRYQGRRWQVYTRKAWIVEGKFMGKFAGTGQIINITSGPIDDCYLVPIRPSDEKLDKVTKFEDDLAQKLKDNLVASQSKKVKT